MDRHDISDIAIDLFRRNGYEQVTVQDICDACGISKPTFYSRFSSKGDILLDFYEDVSLRLNDNLSALMGTTSAWEQLRICFETLMDETESVGYELMSHTLAINLSEDHHSFDERPYLARTMSTIIDRGQRMGEFANSQIRNLPSCSTRHRLTFSKGISLCGASARAKRIGETIFCNACMPFSR